MNSYHSQLKNILTFIINNDIRFILDRFYKIKYYIYIYKHSIKWIFNIKYIYIYYFIEIS